MSYLTINAVRTSHRILRNHEFYSECHGHQIKLLNSFLIEHGRWLALNHNEREAWLEVSLLDNRKTAYKTKPIDIELNGKMIIDMISFLFAFGVSVFGVGQLHYVDLMGLVKIPPQSQKAVGIRMTHFMIVI
ncbi:MAG: hypothetical protein P8179_08720 [Candidatus Thiodiazotropha sp.]